jgi:hypothetical protein
MLTKTYISELSWKREDPERARSCAEEKSESNDGSGKPAAAVTFVDS